MDLIGLADGCKEHGQRGQLREDPGTLVLGPPLHLLAPPYCFVLFCFFISELKALAHHTKCIYEVVISFSMFY